jgi:hypothetical protein
MLKKTTKVSDIRRWQCYREVVSPFNKAGLMCYTILLERKTDDSIEESYIAYPVSDRFVKTYAKAGTYPIFSSLQAELSLTRNFVERRVQVER